MIKVWKWKDFKGNRYELKYVVDEEKVYRQILQFGYNEKEKVRYVKNKLSYLIKEMELKNIKVTIYDDLSFEVKYPKSLNGKEIISLISEAIKQNVNEYYLDRGFSVLNSGEIKVNYRKIVERFYKDMKVFSSFLLKAINNPDDKFSLLERVLSFVQSLPYGVPVNITSERIRGGVFTPWEVLYYGYGDCDSKSLLFATLWMNLAPEIPYVFIEYLNKKHVNIGIKNIWNKQGGTVKVNNIEYIVCETSNCCYPPGSITVKDDFEIF